MLSIILIEPSFLNAKLDEINYSSDYCDYCDYGPEEKNKYCKAKIRTAESTLPNSRIEQNSNKEVTHAWWTND